MENYPEVKPLQALRIDEYSYADTSYKIILERIKEFEDELDTEHEVAVMLASFGQSITMSVSDIGYSNPSTLVFYGYVNNQPATLIQHMEPAQFFAFVCEKI